MQQIELKVSPNSTVIGIFSIKFVHHNSNFVLSKICSSLFAHTTQFSEVYLILENFFETHMLDAKHKSVPVVVCHYGKEVNLKFMKTHMAGGDKFNLVSMDQMKN